MENKKTLEEKGLKKDPGVAYDIADEEKVNSKMVKDQIKIQNNNPRNND